MNAREILRLIGQPALAREPRCNPQCFTDPLNLFKLDPNPTLPTASRLKVPDRERLVAQHQESGPRLGKPIVKARRRDSQTTGRFLGGEELICGHASREVHGTRRCSQPAAGALRVEIRRPS